MSESADPERNGHIVETDCRACAGTSLVAAGEVGGYGFLECRACGFTFAPALSPEHLEELYADGFHGPDEGAPEVGWANSEFLDPAFERLPSKPLDILDFGAGQSVVPDLLRSNGHRVIAVDLAPPSKPHPDRYTGPLDEIDLPCDRYDLVYAFQVFEHLPDPAPVFRTLLDKVAPEGLLLIHTDMHTPERAGGFDRWDYVAPPDHCAFFRHRTFDSMLSDSPAYIEWKDDKTVLIRQPA